MEDGATRRAHIEAAVASGMDPAELDVPACPPEMLYLLGWFLEVSAGRGGNGWGGYNPLSWGEIEAWSRLTGRNLQPFEVGALRQLDGIFLRTLNKAK